MNDRDEVGIDDVDDAARVQSGARAVRVFMHGEIARALREPASVIREAVVTTPFKGVFGNRRYCQN